MNLFSMISTFGFFGISSANYGSPERQFQFADFKRGLGILFIKNLRIYKIIEYNYKIILFSLLKYSY